MNSKSFLAVDCGVFKLGAKARTSFSSTVWMPLFLTLAFASTGYSVPINILDAQYTTIINMSSAVSENNIYRTQSLPVPISDSLYYPSDPSGPTVANANAGLLGISAKTSAFSFAPDLIGGASAFTESDLWFSPLTSQTATINIQIAAGPHFAFISGNVCLTDVTSGNEVWNYGWGSWININGAPSGIDNGTPIQWDNWPTDTPTATLMLDTALNASDTYQLSLRTGSRASSDSENETIQLSGLEPVPEPSAFALVGLGSLALAMVFRRRSPSAVL